MSDPLSAWMRAGTHLPEVMRDFHDQKNLFKAMHALQQPNGPQDIEGPAFQVDWITGQCYVIDRFLWFMARRGYTLQRSRARLPFRDLKADVQAETARRQEAEGKLLMQVFGGGKQEQG